MAFFHAFLLENNQVPDPTFDERDEAALVLFLTHARIRRSADGLEVPPRFVVPEEISTELKKQVKFVAGFLCFFIAKPMTYMRDMLAFRNYFIPGFADDRDKQKQLAQALQPAFYDATLEDLAQANTLNFFFDMDELMIKDPA